MHVLLQIVIGLGLFVKISAKNERENLMKMFSDERKEMREEQKEMRAVFQRENAELRAQNDKQAQEISKQTQEISKQKEEIKLLHKKLHNQNKILHEKLRQRDEEEGPKLEAKIRNAISQERNSSELENVVESVVKRSIIRSGRNDSLETELKKLINSEINDFLINERICVSGFFVPKAKAHTTRTVEFGYEFPRNPAFSASLGRVQNKPSDPYFAEIIVDQSTVTNSSAFMHTYSGTYASVSWIACL